MIIDLSDFLKDKPHIQVYDTYNSFKNNLMFYHDSIDGFLYNIEIGTFIIELYYYNNYYNFVIWNLPLDASISYQENIHVLDIKEALIKAITYCEKYNKLQVFS